MIDILMATYNGEQFVRQQIFSLQAQTYNDWRLLVHDDDSTDNTVEFVKKIAATDSRILLFEDGVRCGGAAENFMYLLKFVENEFVMFTDQDDVWFDNKIDIMFNFFKSFNHDIPQVIYSNSYTWHANKGVTGLATLTFPKDIQSFLFLNSGMQGCVAMFNKKMVELLLRWEGKCAMHDHLLHLIGLTIGKVHYIHLPLMLYRQHEKNITGKASNKIISLEKIINNRNVPVLDVATYNAVKTFAKIYKNEISTDNLKTLQMYLLMPEKNLFQKWKIIIKYKFKIYDSTLNLLVKTIIKPFIKC